MKNLEVNRGKVTVINTEVRGIDSIHFTGLGLQNATDHFTNHKRDLWFPVKGDLFKSIEDVLVLNGIAHNVVSVEKVRQINDKCADYDVVFNYKV